MTKNLESHLPPGSQTLRSRGKLLEMSDESFGFLQPSPSHDSSQSELRDSLEQNGYLFVRDMFSVSEVLDVRNEICEVMYEEGWLDPDANPSDCIPHPQVVGNDDSQGSTSLDSIPTRCGLMRQLLYGQTATAFFEKLLGGSVRHYDLTWFRGVAPGLGTVPHCDVVYMGRGTHELFTCWVPYGWISLGMGGLMVLEGSMDDRVQQKIQSYLCRDVDDYCENRPLPEHVDLDSRTDNKVWNGWLARNPVRLRENLGGRWLTAEFRPGDALIFSCKLVHASLDNQSDRFRLSSDCRYQRADQPIDERFIGGGPYGHVGTAKRGRVC